MESDDIRDICEVDGLLDHCAAMVGDGGVTKMLLKMEALEVERWDWEMKR